MCVVIVFFVNSSYTSQSPTLFLRYLVNSDRQTKTNTTMVYSSNNLNKPFFCTAAMIALASTASAAIPASECPHIRADLAPLARFGSSVENPEHVIKGYKDAEKLGLAGSVVCLHPTVDDHLVARHTNALNRNTDAPEGVLVTQSTLEYIETLDAGFQHLADECSNVFGQLDSDADCSTEQAYPWRGRGLYVPTFDKILDKNLQGRRTLVDVKPADGFAGNATASQHLADLVRSSYDNATINGRFDREGGEMVIGSVDSEIAGAIRTAFAGAPNVYFWASEATSRAYLTGLIGQFIAIISGQPVPTVPAPTDYVYAPVEAVAGAIAQVLASPTFPSFLHPALAAHLFNNFVARDVDMIWQVGDAELAGLQAVTGADACSLLWPGTGSCWNNTPLLLERLACSGASHITHKDALMLKTTVDDQQAVAGV